MYVFVKNAVNGRSVVTKCIILVISREDFIALITSVSVFKWSLLVLFPLDYRSFVNMYALPSNY